jgi:ArsR family transcriptional regulator, arsenate/arsenite/antimonite-responsive transcriptional repressor
MRNETLRSTLKVTKALSDVQRLRILMMLRGGELCVCQIIAVLKLAPSTVSKHLSLLSDADLVIYRKEGRWAHFQLPQGEALKRIKPVMTWLEHSVADDPVIRADEKKRKEVMACSPEGLRENLSR